MRRASARPLLALAVVTLIALAVAPAPLAAGWPNSNGPYDPHGPITITSNAHFTAANGVRSGSGSVADPYVISGWSFSNGGITIKGVTAAFVIRENLVVVTASSWAITIEDVQVPSWVVDNVVKFHQGGGIRAIHADPLIADNSVTGGSWSYSQGIGVFLDRSNGVVRENMISESAIGVKARYASPHVRDNNLGVIGNGILLEHMAPGANASGNIVANFHGYGIWLNYGQNVTIEDNLIEQGQRGIEVWSCLAVEINLNLIHDMSKVGIMFESCNGTAMGNVVIDGKAGIQVWQSDAIILNNTISNHLAIGVEWMMSEGVMASNTLARNGVGVKLQDMGIVRLRGNVMTNNTIGIDLPYVARQSIPYMQGNLVNGLNVDGTLVASQKAYFYKEANVTIEGGVFDSGFGASLYGAATAQGGVNLYEVDTAYVNASVFSHNRVGVYVVNSFNVQINASLIVNNVIGVNVTIENSMGQIVPRCVAFVKNTTIIIEVDPPLTFGIRNERCHMGVYNNTISGMDVGVYFGAQATGEIVGNAIYRTGTGLHVEGTTSQPNDVLLVHDNHVWANKRGALLRASGSDWKSNLVHDNSREGMKLEYGSHPLLRANNFSRNANGVVDATSCLATGASCSKIVRATGNTYYSNAGVGLAVNGGAAITGDRFVANGANGFDLRGDVTITNALAHSNGGSGGFLAGYSVVKGSTFRSNEGNGLVALGTLTLQESVFKLNTESGIRSTANWLSGYKLDISQNKDGMLIDAGGPSVAVPATPYPYIQPTSILFGDGPDGGFGAIAGSQVFLHRSTLVGNERDAISAGLASVNATYNYWGNPNGPVIDTGATGQFQNGITPLVQFVPWFRDAGFTTTGPVAGL